MSHLETRYVFVAHPDDWRGRTVEIFSDGAVMLDSGLFSKERKAGGDLPLHTFKIGERTTPSDIVSFLRFHGVE